MTQNQDIKTPNAKRAFDICLSLFLIVLSLPLMLLILAAIFIENIFRWDFSFKLFYIEKRISQGSAFNFIKFNIFKPEVIRGMKQNGEFIHTKNLEHDKKSMIHVGRLIQKIYFDELPQLFNILVGNISFVGPRPLNLKTYQKKLERGNNIRQIMKSGLTGNYQAHKGEDNNKQLKQDLDYLEFIKNNSSGKIVINDIKIILRTLVIVFRAEGL